MGTLRDRFNSELFKVAEDKDKKRSTKLQDTFGNKAMSKAIDLLNPDTWFDQQHTNPSTDFDEFRTKYPDIAAYKTGISDSLLSSGQSPEILKAISYLPSAKRNIALTMIEKGTVGDEFFKKLVTEGNAAREQEATLQLNTDKKFNPPEPKPESPSMMSNIGTGAAILGGAKLLDIAISKGMDIWKKNKKSGEDEESFDRIMSSHPKFKNVSSEEMPRLKALHSMITDYSPTLKDHEMVLGDVLHNAAQYQDFDPSLLKTLTEPERNIAGAHKDPSSVFNDPVLQGVGNLGKFRDSLNQVSGAQ